MTKFRENFCAICLLTNRSKNVIIEDCPENSDARACARAAHYTTHLCFCQVVKLHKKNRALRTARSVLTYQPIIEMLGWQIP